MTTRKRSIKILVPLVILISLSLSLFIFSATVEGNENNYFGSCAYNLSSTYFSYGGVDYNYNSVCNGSYTYTRGFMGESLMISCQRINQDSLWTPNGSVNVSVGLYDLGPGTYNSTIYYRTPDKSVMETYLTTTFGGYTEIQTWDSIFIMDGYCVNYVYNTSTPGGWSIAGGSDPPKLDLYD
jgi:hypothetical protein